MYLVYHKHTRLLTEYRCIEQRLHTCVEQRVQASEINKKHID